MRVAIYARYSSENQSEKSIDDQIRVCKNYIKNNDMVFEDKHIYIDEAISEIKFKPYYIAHTKIQTLALLDDQYNSSNWLHWRRRRDSVFRL
ncbi:MAG: recombinase family protein, partial [Candidatus Humimicrobiaceae bacterium]